MSISTATTNTKIESMRFINNINIFGIYTVLPWPAIESLTVASTDTSSLNLMTLGARLRQWGLRGFSLVPFQRGSYVLYMVGSPRTTCRLGLYALLHQADKSIPHTKRIQILGLSTRKLYTGDIREN